jgi:hypothetical protein
MIVYTDGSLSWLKIGKNVSDGAKSIEKFKYDYYSGSQTLNYNQCGIFEGVITEEEFEEYQETVANIPIAKPLYEGDYIEVYADGSGQIYRKYRRFKSTTVNGTHSKLGAEVILDGVYAKSTLTAYSNYFIPYDYNIHSDNHTNTFIFGNHKVGAYSSAYFNVDGLTTKKEYQAWLDEHSDLEFVYELTTPTTERLTAEQVNEFMKLQTFKGVTHVTADGEVVMRYYCNTDSGETVEMLHNMIDNIPEPDSTITQTSENAISSQAVAGAINIYMEYISSYDENGVVQLRKPVPSSKYITPPTVYLKAFNDTIQSLVAHVKKLETRVTELESIWNTDNNGTAGGSGVEE